MRTSGIIAHISSLPSPYGIGTLGRAAYEFIDFLSAAGQKYWQILPVGPTSFGDSPYQSYSTFAGNPYFIDLEKLAEDGLLDKQELDAVDWYGHPEYVDYDRQYEHRFRFLRKAFEASDYTKKQDYWAFAEQNKSWLDNYSLFMALKEYFGGKPWTEWDSDIKRREPLAVARYTAQFTGEMDFWRYVQYLFFSQWNKLKEYAGQKGISIIGDIPIYVALDSADAWADNELFLLDGSRNPVKVAGCPPDAFSATGQLWGNPLYDWDYHRRTGFDWWVRRVEAANRIYDRIRIDHFRGFDTFYAIPYGDATAERGEWMQGPGMELFNALKARLGSIDIIAEDLGYLTESVHELLRQSGYPGMKVLQFAFDDSHNSSYLPHYHIPNCVVYTGTHDNNTVCGWLSSAPENDVIFCRHYLRLNEEEGEHWGFIKAAWASVADTAIAQIQDFLGLGSEARMNVPSTFGTNWKWRMKENALTPELAGKIRDITFLYGRLNG